MHFYQMDKDIMFLMYDIVIPLPQMAGRTFTHCSGFPYAISGTEGYAVISMRE